MKKTFAQNLHVQVVTMTKEEATELIAAIEHGLYATAQDYAEDLIETLQLASTATDTEHHIVLKVKP